MSPQLPSFLRRRLRLSEARKALLAGDPEGALGHLGDPCLAGAEDADKLRERVLDALCRSAGQRVEEGLFAESDRLLELVMPHDARRAKAWRHRLEVEAEGSQVSHRSGVRRAAESGIVQAMEGLLGRLRKEQSRAFPIGATDSGPVSAPDVPASRSAEIRADRGSPEELSFMLAVDDIGEYHVARTPEVTIGHSQAGCADLPVLADLDPRHARLIRTESFHSGPGWRIEPTQKQTLAIGGELIDPGGAALLDGDVVQVSPNVAFCFRRPEAASGSAVLEWLHGIECHGASRVLLFAPGPAGLVRIGNRSGRHMQARRATDEIALWLEGAELVVESAGRLNARGVDSAIQAAGDSGPGGLRIPCPPAGRVDFTVGAGGPQGPPFGFSVRPTPERESGGSEQ